MKITTLTGRKEGKPVAGEEEGTQPKGKRIGTAEENRLQEKIFKRGEGPVKNWAETPCET